MHPFLPNKSISRFAVAATSLLLVFYFLPIIFNWDNKNEGTNTAFTYQHRLTDQPIPEKWSKWNLYTVDSLLNYLRAHHLTPPAAFNEPYNLSVKYPGYSEHDRYHDEVLKIVEKYHKLDGGFFVEAGALDGQYLSQTLDLEMKYKWNGLLVEASPAKTKELQSKKRKCWTADVCLTGQPFMEIDYISKRDQDEGWKRGNGKINPLEFGESPRKFEGQDQYFSEGKVECFSLFSLLTALQVRMVDLLVLDIEGHELQVLSNYPFHLIPIKVISVEHNLIPESFDGKLELLMLQKGYSMVYKSISDHVYVLNTTDLVEPLLN